MAPVALRARPAFQPDDAVLAGRAGDRRQRFPFTLGEGFPPGSVELDLDDLGLAAEEVEIGAADLDQDEADPFLDPRAQSQRALALCYGDTPALEADRGGVALERG